jgi:hypothetical protein
MSQRAGFTPIFILIGVVVLAIFAVSVYKLLNPNAFVTLPGLGTIGLNAKCIANDPDLCKFMNRIAYNKHLFGQQLTIVSQHMDSAGNQSQITFSLQKPSHYSVQLSDNGQEKFALRRISNTIFVKDLKDNSWWKEEVTSSARRMPTQYNADAIKTEMEKNIQNALTKQTFKKMEKKEICEAYTCFKYQIINPEATQETEYLLFDDKHYVLRKMIRQNSEGEITEDNFSYKKVKIVQPENTKSPKPAQNIYATQNGQTNEGLDYLEDFEQQLQKSDENGNGGPQFIDGSPSPTLSFTAPEEETSETEITPGAPIPLDAM